MGNIVHKTFQRLFGKRQVRILIMGLEAAGKTTLLYKIKLGEIVTTVPSSGFYMEYITTKNVVLTAWNVGGRSPLRPLYRHYYHNTQGVVYVIDSSDHDRLKQAIDELARIVGEDELAGVPVMILANKQDLPGAMSPETIASQCKTMMKDRAWNVFGVSATAPEDNDLLYAFGWLVTALEAKQRQDIVMNWTQASKDDEKKKKFQTNSVGKNSLLRSFTESLKRLLVYDPSK